MKSLNNLLIDTGQFQTIVLGCFCALLALAFLYGVLRKLSRMSWLGWQSVLIWLATLPLGALPKDSAPLAFGVSVGVLLVAVILVFLVGALVRKPFLGLEGGGMGGKVFNRLAGGITGVFNVFAFFAIFGGLAFALAQPFGVEAFDVVYSNALWQNFFGAHALDLFLAFWFAVILRWGYRTGFLRAIVSLTVLTLAFLAVFLSMYMTLHVPFIASLSSAIAGAIKINEIAAGWIGFAITSFIVSLVFLLVIIFIGWVLNLLLKLAGKSKAFLAIDGILFAVITCVILLLGTCAFNFGINYLFTLVESDAWGMGENLAQILPYLENIEKAFTSSPLAAILYECNPLRLIIG